MKIKFVLIEKKILQNFNQFEKKLCFSFIKLNYKVNLYFKKHQLGYCADIVIIYYFLFQVFQCNEILKIFITKIKFTYSTLKLKI